MPEADPPGRRVQNWNPLEREIHWKELIVDDFKISKKI
jgi:hypothetical protein